MPPLITRIDPALRPCWENERTLRFGFEYPVTRIVDPSASTQRLVVALLKGVRSDRLASTLRQIGVTQTEWSQATAELGGALQHAPAPSAASTRGRSAEPASWVTARGPESVVAQASEIFARAGLTVNAAFHAPGARHLTVAFERYLARPSHAHTAGEPDRPQLTVRFGDQCVDIGPLSSSPQDPCPGCATLWDIDADPPLTMLAAQLHDQLPASETPAIVEFVVAIATAMIRAWLAGDDRVGTMRYRVRTTDGLPHVVVQESIVMRHPDCGCGLTRPSGARLLR